MGDIVDFRRKTNDNEDEIEALMNKEEFIIDNHASNDAFRRQVDELWHNLYCRMKITNMYADDDGKIGYTARWANAIEVDPDYESSLKESLNIASEFINNNSLSSKFMEYYDAEIEKRDVLKLLVIGNKEKSPIPDQEN